MMVVLFNVACAPDGPSVVRESDPSLVEQATSSTSENRSTESTEDKVGQVREDEVSGTDIRVGGSATVLLAADPTPITGWTPWDHVCAWSCRNVLDQVLETITVVLPDGSTAPWLAE